MLGPELWALEQLGGALPTSVQEYGSSVLQEALARAQQTAPFQAGAYLAGTTPEQMDRYQQKLKEQIAAAQEFRGQTGVGRALNVLGGGPATAEAKPAIPTPPPVSPPSPKPEAAVAEAKPRTKQVIRMVTDPASGRQVFVNEAVPLEENEELTPVPTSADEIRQRAVLEQKWGNRRTLNPQTTGQGGDVNPLGFSARETPGAFSYAGTEGFDRTREYSPEEFRALHPLEQREIMEREAAERQRSMGDLAEREQLAAVKQREAAVEEAADPVGYRQRLVGQYVETARQQLGDPNSVLAIKYRMAMQDYMTKNPQATQQQVDEFAALLMQALPLEEAQRNASLYGSLIQQYDPRVLSALARNSLGFGLPQGGPGGAGTP